MVEGFGRTSSETAVFMAVTCCQTPALVSSSAAVISSSYGSCSYHPISMISDSEAGNAVGSPGTPRNRQTKNRGSRVDLRDAQDKSTAAAGTLARKTTR